MSSKPAWQYRRRDEGALHGPYDDDKILSWFGKPQSVQEAKDLEFRNIMDADIAWMPLTEVLARFKTDLCTTQSDSSSQDESVSALTSHCGYGSFTGVSPPSSDEQPDSSVIPTPRDQSVVLTAPSSPENRDNKKISHKEAFEVTLGRVADKVAYRSACEGRPGIHHTKNVMKNYVCWCLMPDKQAKGAFAWGPLKLEEVLLAAYENAIFMDTLLAVVDASVPDYVMHPSTDVLKMIAMPFHEHVVAQQQCSPVTWSIRQIEEFVGPSAVQHTSTVNSELLDTIPRSSASRLMQQMSGHGLPTDSFDSTMWPDAHLDLTNSSRMRQRPHSCSQLPPIAVLQHQQSRHHGGVAANRALDEMFLPPDAPTNQPHSSLCRARNDSRAPVVHGFDDWQGKKFIVDEATRQRIKNSMIEMVKNSVVPPVETKLPPALANPPPTQSMQKRMPSLTMCIPVNRSDQMQQMPIPTSTTRNSNSHPFSARNSFSNEELLSLTYAPTRSRPNSRPASYSQVPQEFNIHAADFTPSAGDTLSAPDVQPTMDSHVQSDMERIASSFSGQLDFGGGNVSSQGMNQGLFTAHDAAPMRQTDPGTLHGHNMIPSDPAAVATAAAAVLNPDQLNSVLTQMASKMNCPTAHVQDLLHSLTQVSRRQYSNADMNTPTEPGQLKSTHRVMPSQPAVSGSMGQWPGVNDGGNHTLGGQALTHSLHQSLLPPHLQPFFSSNLDYSRQRSVQCQSLAGNDSLSNFGSGQFGGLKASLSGAGNIVDTLGRGHGFANNAAFNDRLECMDLGLGQM